MELDQLKPCPFCGGSDLALQDYTDRIYGFWDYRIVEIRGGTFHQTPNDETKAKAKRELFIHWNRRAGDEQRKQNHYNDACI